ncbi:MAG: aspartate carbamoyltransferase [Ruminococcaceae bacterium]|nr:aspartate carbamoyltransferase [Oscillospiraceae bacterium]
MRSLIDIPDFSVAELDELIACANDIIRNPDAYRDACRGKKLATMFFEPSTRTRLSFEAAMLELGGSVIGFSDPETSSAAKGESVADTARVVSCYADIIAMRHPREGAPYVASQSATIPVINAGDGGHAHPTQTLGDLLTIHREKGRLDHLTVGFCGDLKYGRTVHSLIAALSRYEGIKIVLISPEELKLPDYVKLDVLEKCSMPYTETASLEEAMPGLDILYMTRIQRERFTDPEEYERLKDSYILTQKKMELAKADMSVMHPLPRVNEISVKVDSDPRACYFRQAKNGKFMRMALILKLLEEAKINPEREKPEGELLVNEIQCRNPRCISACEQELDHVFKVTDQAGGVCRCLYCESKEMIQERKN